MVEDQRRGIRAQLLGDVVEMNDLVIFVELVEALFPLLELAVLPELELQLKLLVLNKSKRPAATGSRDDAAAAGSGCVWQDATRMLRIPAARRRSLELFGGRGASCRVRRWRRHIRVSAESPVGALGRG